MRPSEHRTVGAAQPEVVVTLAGSVDGVAVRRQVPLKLTIYANGWLRLIFTKKLQL